MTVGPEISQRDLRFKSKEIMDAVEHGSAFTVTRDGRPMGQLIPLRRPFVTRAQFAANSRRAAPLDLDEFRADQDRTWSTGVDDPYER